MCALLLSRVYDSVPPSTAWFGHSYRLSRPTGCLIECPFFLFVYSLITLLVFIFFMVRPSPACFFVFFFILRRMWKNKALAHDTSTYFHTSRRVSITWSGLLCCELSYLVHTLAFHLLFTLMNCTTVLFGLFHRVYTVTYTAVPVL